MGVVGVVVWYRLPPPRPPLLQIPPLPVAGSSHPHPPSFKDGNYQLAVGGGVLGGDLPALLSSRTPFTNRQLHAPQFTPPASPPLHRWTISSLRAARSASPSLDRTSHLAAELLEVSYSTVQYITIIYFTIILSIYTTTLRTCLQDQSFGCRAPGGALYYTIIIYTIQYHTTRYDTTRHDTIRLHHAPTLAPTLLIRRFGRADGRRDGRRTRQVSRYTTIL